MTSRQRVVLVLAFALSRRFCGGNGAGEHGREVRPACCVPLLRRAARLREVARLRLRRAVRLRRAGRRSAVAAKGAPRRDRPGRTAGGAKPRPTRRPRSRASTTPARTSRRRASTSPTSSRRTARRSSRSRTGCSTPSTSRGAQPRLLDSLKLDSGWSHELLLHGDRLLVLSRGGYWAEPLPAMAARMHAVLASESVLTEVDVSNPNALKVVQTLTLDGAYVDARLVGSASGSSPRRRCRSSCRSSSPSATRPTARAAATRAEPRRRRLVARRELAAAYRIKRAGQAAQAARRSSSAATSAGRRAFSGLGMLTVLTIDLDKGIEPVDSVAVMTDGGSSTRRRRASTSRPSAGPTGRPSTPTTPTRVTTTIHKFDISSPTKTRLPGSGSVAGLLLNQWSLSEFQGVLRVVSTSRRPGGASRGESESF